MPQGRPTTATDAGTPRPWADLTPSQQKLVRLQYSDPEPHQWSFDTGYALAWQLLTPDVPRTSFEPSFEGDFSLPDELLGNDLQHERLPSD